MSSDDIEKIWRQIDAEINQHEDLKLNDYLSAQGLSAHAGFESLNVNVQNLVNHMFDPADIKSEALNSKYRIIKQIDSGGQSDVYLAERSDGVYQQTVVIKFISGQFDQTALKQQFLQEMQLLADLKHPGVVTIIDGNITPQGQPWLVLEYIDGLHIDQYAKQHQLSTADVVGLMMSLCETLQFIHRRQVLHKDLKPSNVMIKPINQIPHPVLIDFGIAMQAGAQPGLTFGTKGFSAPEQTQGATSDQRTDLYALGKLFAYLLLSENDRETTIINGDAAFLSALKQSDTPKDLCAVIAKLTEADPAKRYQSADALRSDLNQWQLGFPLSVNNKLSTVVSKTVKRHPWVTLAVCLALLITVWFTVKYTRDTQHLQQLTVAEKNATDELMNFMLDDMFENLERIGRIDVLQTVAEKSVSHLQQQDPQTLDQSGHQQAAKAYINTGRVFDALEQSAQAQKMFLSAEQHLNQSRIPGADLAYYELLAELRVYQSQVLPSEGQEQLTEQVLQEAVAAMQQVLAAEPSADPRFLWEAHLELGYYLMEYARPEQALSHINQALAITQQQTTTNPNALEWLYRQSHSYQLKAWYELDFGELSTGVEDTQKAVTAAQTSAHLDHHDLKKHNNLRILYNQMAYFYLEAGQQEAAMEVVTQAISLGKELRLKAPFNQEYQREHAFSLSTAGEIHQDQGDLKTALQFYQQSMQITEANHAKDPNNFSVANDLAVDYLLLANLHQKDGNEVAAQTLFHQAEALIEPVYQAEKNNKYYAQTLLVVKLYLSKLEEAKPLFDQTVKNDMVDNVIEALLEKHQLQEWQP